MRVQERKLENFVHKRGVLVFNQEPKMTPVKLLGNLTKMLGNWG